MDEVIAVAAEDIKEEDIVGAVYLSDNEESLVEAGGILSWEECVRQGNCKGGPNSLNMTKTSVAPPILTCPRP